jgi:polyisoprenoid-binding protein YceI
MKQRNRTELVPSALLSLLAATLIVGCGNPADGVQEANVTASSGEPAAAAVEGATAYTVNADSKIEFTGSKITGSHSGGFSVFTGAIYVADGKIVSPSKIEIDMESTWSDSDRLTGHLTNADFFDLPTFPTSSFALTSIDETPEGHNVTGDLTLHGVTKSISFAAKVGVSDSQVTLNAEFFIKRYDFDMVFKGKPDDLIRDEVVIKLDVKADA